MLQGSQILLNAVACVFGSPSRHSPVTDRCFVVQRLGSSMAAEYALPEISQMSVCLQTWPRLTRMFILSKFLCTVVVSSNGLALHLHPARAAAAHAGQQSHEQDHHCGRADRNSISSKSLWERTRRGAISKSRNSQMKVRRIKKAPSSTGVALGRPCSLAHNLLRRLRVSSAGSILTRQRQDEGIYSEMSCA